MNIIDRKIKMYRTDENPFLYAIITIGGYIMNIIEEVEKYVKEQIEIYKNNSEDHYDFWDEHIKYVYDESIKLAKAYNADMEIVSLGALLHDISLINKVGEKKDHHINSEMIAREILNNLKYDESKRERVLRCVYNHRSSKNATTIEELCVGDADILAHFDNIPMLFNLAYNKNNIQLSPKISGISKALAVKTDSRVITKDTNLFFIR